jgi:hypothetical protein
MLGYDKPLYLMAFDHRGSFEHDLFGASDPVSARLQALAAGAPPSARGVLVDEEFGKASRPEAVDRIAARYRDIIDAYRGADSRAGVSSSAANGASR